MNPALFWPQLFALTVLLELPLVLWLTAEAEPSRARRAIIILGAQLATHPLVFFFFPALPLASFQRLALSEIFACLCEAGLYAAAFRGLSLRRALGVAFLANGFSFGAGLLIYR